METRKSDKKVPISPIMKQEQSHHSISKLEADIASIGSTEKIDAKIDKSVDQSTRIENPIIEQVVIWVTSPFILTATIVVLTGLGLAAILFFLIYTPSSPTYTEDPPDPRFGQGSIKAEKNSITEEPAQSTPCWETTTITGKITRTENSEPLSSATVLVRDAESTTNEFGHYSLEVKHPCNETDATIEFFVEGKKVHSKLIDIKQENIPITF